MTCNLLTQGVSFVVLLGASLGFTACGSDPLSVPVPTWEEFRALSERTVEGRTFYVVEWDLAIPNEEELLRYYEEHFVFSRDPHRDSEIGTSSRNLIVNRVGGRDDAWRRTNGVTLTYCVSNTFGGAKARALREMDEATTNWQSITNVNFVYLPNEDSTCSNANPDIDIPVRPWSGGGGCAFFPSGGGCVENTLVIDYDDLDNNPDYDTDAPNMTTTGVFRHELGHILGFRHEHTRPESGACFEDNNWRELSDYDVRSVMHYPFPACNGFLASDLSLSTLDKFGVVQLYKLSASITVSLL